ncbi:putative NAD-dependent malic enzyme [Peptostreptococcaceae bacterium oral taxon 113 str. W5053]|nr:putative NAD-dependent malic enzyme [Peptostreptococcaceae bacterium oral taxon 113 str. W5053]
MGDKEMDYNQAALELHEKNRGKIRVVSQIEIRNKDDLATAYTPGVAEPCRKIHENSKEVYRYTAKSHLIAVVTDGSAVLGLGNIGPMAAMPVMEGKAILFKEYGDVDAVPICLDTNDTEEIIRTVKTIAPGFGGINLEDISAPRCFEIEKRLKEELDIPVFHDDQHGTAVITVAAIMNALKLVDKREEEVKAVISGAGAAGIAIAKMLLDMGVKRLYICDSQGAVWRGNPKNNVYKEEIAQRTNPENIQGSLSDMMSGADIFIGVSGPGIVTKEMVHTMNKDAIILAMANPVPEIYPEEAKAAGAKIVGTGRSDFSNQINNVLAFPGIFRGALEARATEINQEMNLAAAKAIADMVGDKLSEDYIVPDALDKSSAEAVSQAVKEAAIRSGVARI